MRDENNNLKFLLFSYVIILSIGMCGGILFSPHIAFWCSTLLLISGLGKVTIIRNSLILVSLIMVIFTTTSRTIGISNSDDLISTYMPIVQTQVDHLGIFGTWMGIEIGYGLYFNIILSFIKELTPRQVLFFSVLFSMTIYYIWITKFFIRKIDYKNRGVAAAISLSFIQVGLLSQFLRQEMATPFLLISIFYMLDRRTSLSIIYLAVATIFHSTSIIIFGLFYFFVHAKFAHKIIVFGIFALIIAVIRFDVSLIISILDSIHLGILGSKLSYYQGMEAIPLSSVISSGKFFILILIVYIISEDRSKLKERVGLGTLDKLYVFCFFASLYSLPLLILPNASRLFLIVPGFLFSLVVLKSFPKKNGYIVIAFTFFCLLSFLFPQRLNGGVSIGFDLWTYYNWYEFEPFYYLNLI